MSLFSRTCNLLDRKGASLFACSNGGAATRFKAMRPRAGGSLWWWSSLCDVHQAMSDSTPGLNADVVELTWDEAQVLEVLES